jgi:hypothetical protein
MTKVENLDDLDEYLDGIAILILDVLDEFSKEPTIEKTTKAPIEDPLNDDFMALLQENMSKLLVGDNIGDIPKKIENVLDYDASSTQEVRRF